VADRDLAKRFDPIVLIAGLMTLLASAYVLTDGKVWQAMPDPRWFLAGGAVVVGLLLLLGSTVRGKRK
jgi:NADH:ubiquinone oxidoreductase subunit B-like Fe-S oxidoreductase